MFKHTFFIAVLLLVISNGLMAQNNANDDIPLSKPATTGMIVAGSVVAFGGAGLIYTGANDIKRSGTTYGYATELHTGRRYVGVGVPLLAAGLGVVATATYYRLQYNKNDSQAYMRLGYLDSGAVGLAMVF